MTKLWIQSDQHFEIYGTPREFAVPQADIFVCAGDLMREPAKAMRWLDTMLPIPTVYVAGNHEYYRGIYTTWRDEAVAETSLHPKIHYIENTVAEVFGIRFIGCTLWTDYALYGADTVDQAKWNAATRMNDFQMIAYASDSAGRSWKNVRLTPNQLAIIHSGSKKFLEQELAKPFSGSTVVVTHHAPHTGSIHLRYADDPVTPAFVSDLSGLIERHQPDLWVHGHVHSCFDYHVGRTRIVANPQGYAGENPGFDPGLIIEL